MTHEYELPSYDDWKLRSDDDREPPFGYGQPEPGDYWEDAEPMGFDAYTAAHPPTRPDKLGVWYCPRCRVASRFIAEPYYIHLAQCQGNLGGQS